MVPPGHCSHSEEPVTFEYFPFSHFMQYLLELAPTKGLYRPAGQAVQVTEDSILTKRPEGH